MNVNYYYSNNVPAGEQEDSLLHLCGACARQHAANVTWASRGDEDAECEFCGASNNEAHSRDLDAAYERINGRPAPARRVA